jgi:hypothetical protein
MARPTGTGTASLDPTTEDYGGIDPLAHLLIHLLYDRIRTLAKLYRAGAWRHHPSEIGDWLRPRTLRKGKGAHQVLINEARQEFQLETTGCNEGLLEAIAAETDIHIDEGRIIALAIQRGKEKSRRGPIGPQHPNLDLKKRGIHVRKNKPA